MRRILIEELVKEVLGPRSGSEETIEGDPSKEYITGVIIPRRCKRKLIPDPDSEDIITMGDDVLSEDNSEENEIAAVVPSELDPKMKPRSFGISFLVTGNNPTMRICVTWGRYIELDEGASAFWKRKPYGKIVDITLHKDEKQIPVYTGSDGKIILLVRKIVLGKSNHIIITLINDLEVDDEHCYGESLTRSSIFQPSLRVRLLGDAQLAPPRSEGNRLHFLYRNRPVLARGFMCSAIWKDIDYSDQFDPSVIWADGHDSDEFREFLECDVRSEFVPIYPNPASIFEWDERMIREFGKPPELSARNLSEMWDKEDVERYLSPLVIAYQRWIDGNESMLQNWTLSSEFNGIASGIIHSQRTLLQRLKSGIELLMNDDDVRLAFCFANKTIWLQNRWKKKSGDFKWWPFQLAFILMVLESLSNQDSEFREFTDLLWIPTGGGKTEAYLALFVFVMALRRRRARNHGNRVGGGTAVLTRYTLRLLTIQQFRRILKVVTAAEYLRVLQTGQVRGWRPSKCSNDEDLIFGSLRFSVGIWVGGSVSPNHLRKKGHAIDALLEKGEWGDPAQVIKCPSCGAYTSVPDSGLPPGEKLFLVIMSDEDPNVIRDAIASNSELMKKLESVDIKSHGNWMTLVLTVGDNRLRGYEIDELWRGISNLTQARLLSFRASRPGYFGCSGEPGRKKERPRDFEIYCPNPDCELNREVTYVEGVPLNPGGGRDILPDGLVKKQSQLPFAEHRVPIPAYTVDEQIYCRCPTIIVSTADKIARLAFEPRAAAIFGNVDKYNAYYGYYRKDLTPSDTTKAALASDNSVAIDPFDPPELIVQDELHLMEGPLGSMFGLYERAVEALLLLAKKKPKYVVSTATIRDAELQVKRLFGRELFQFPPYGLDIEDSFFVRTTEWQDGWKEDTPGRIYLGLYAPGLGPLTPQVRIWARLLKSCNDHRNNPAVKYFWTVVGYFNAMRELGGGRALYREDIIERLRHITSGVTRVLDPGNVYELSSRVSSTEIPVILDDLESGGMRSYSENPDAIFTTSMFGTGVDISHLSIMIVNGQPKTTSQYIQATGRVGRRHGGLVVTFLKAGRARDLSHYEMFPAYHHRIYLEVEPSSVSPFSMGCLARASGPVLVSFLRNMPSASVDWYSKQNGTAILLPNATKDVQTFLRIVTSSASSNSSNSQTVDNYFKSQWDKWHNVATNLDKSNESLWFHEWAFKMPEHHVVLGDSLHEKSTLKVVYKNAPQSLREIEETTGFEV